MISCTHYIKLERKRREEILPGLFSFLVKFHSCRGEGGWVDVGWAFMVARRPPKEIICSFVTLFVTILRWFIHII